MQRTKRYYQVAKRKLVRRFLILDMAANAYIFHDKKRRTISEHCGEELYVGRPCLFCLAVHIITNWFSKNHCIKTYYKYNKKELD